MWKCEAKTAPLPHTGQHLRSARPISSDALSCAMEMILLPRRDDAREESRGARDPRFYCAFGDAAGAAASAGAGVPGCDPNPSGKSRAGVILIAQMVPASNFSWRGTRKSDPREQILARHVGFDLRCRGRISRDFRRTDKRRTGAAPNPDDGRAATPDTFRLPALRTGLNQQAVVLVDEPDRNRVALIAVFADGRDIDELGVLPRRDIARRRGSARVRRKSLPRRISPRAPRQAQILLHRILLAPQSPRKRRRTNTSPRNSMIASGSRIESALWRIVIVRPRCRASEGHAGSNSPPVARASRRSRSRSGGRSLSSAASAESDRPKRTRAA